MKKFFLLGAAMLALFATSCSNDDIAGNSNEIGTGKTISLNATINNGAETRLTYTDDADNNKMTVAWSSEESFTLYKGTSSSGSLFTNTSAATGTFTGPAIEGGNEGDKYYAVYGGNHISNTGGTLSIDLSGAQVGTAADNGIKEFMLATADALTNETSLEFKHKLTVLKLTLTLPSDVTGPVSKVTVSGLHNKASYTLSADAYDAYADADKGDITATNGTTGFEIKSTGDGETTTKSFTAYVAVFPEKIFPNQVKITAFVDDNDYSYTIALNEGVSDLQLQENQVMPVQVTLAATKRNFKSAYTKEDFFYWDAYTYVTNGNEKTFGEGGWGYNTGSEKASHSCASCPTASQMVAYLKAGVYWDDNTTVTEGQMTYSAPVTLFGEIKIVADLHTGLWVKKKSKITNFDSETATEYTTDETTFKKLSSLSDSDVKEIRTGGDYFFLPAAGYNRSDSFNAAGSSGVYWSSSPNGNSNAYFLLVHTSGARMLNASRDYGSLPMIAE